MKFLILLAFVGLAVANQGEEYFLSGLRDRLREKYDSARQDIIDAYNDVKNNVQGKIDNFDWQKERLEAIKDDAEAKARTLYNEEKEIAQNLFEDVKDQVKARVDSVIAQTKGQIKHLKATLMRSKDAFLEEFEDVVNDALDRATEQLPLNFEEKATEAKIQGNLVKRLTSRLESYTDVLKGNFEDYYRRLLETTSEAIDDLMIIANSEQQSIQASIDVAVEAIVDTAINGGAEEFGLLLNRAKEVRGKVRKFVKETYHTAKAFAKKTYSKVRTFIKARVDAIVAETKEIWQDLKGVAKEKGTAFVDDLNEILEETIDNVFAPIPPNPNVEVSENEIKRSFVEEISYAINQRVNEFSRNFDIRYKRLVDATADATENLYVAINELKVPMNEAIQDAVEDVVDVTLNG